MDFLGFFIEGAYQGLQRAVAESDYRMTVCKLLDCGTEGIKIWGKETISINFVCLQTTTMDTFWRTVTIDNVFVPDLENSIATYLKTTAWKTLTSYSTQTE